MSSNIWFFLAVLGIATALWFLRTLVESDPDPFFLNFTFFAFAGQCIRTSELLDTGRLRPVHGGLLLGSFIIVAVQVFVMKKHKRLTFEHYRFTLKAKKNDGCSDRELDHWANVLLRITGVDFHPGGYAWWASLFDTEPREERREQAFSILPDSHFQLRSENVEANVLMLPDSSERRRYWWSYVGCCIVAWMLFGAAVFIHSDPLRDAPNRQPQQAVARR